MGHDHPDHPRKRGYAWKKGQALVPTWTAFAVVRLLEEHFDELVDYTFTAGLEDDLDAIALGDQEKVEWLKDFYFGTEHPPGLKALVADNLDKIGAAEINTFLLGYDGDGDEIVVKPGKYGPYVKRGEDTASVPETLTPDELTIHVALELLAAPKSDEPIGFLDGLPVFAKNGRFGPYVQWGEAGAPPPGYDKPKMASLFKTMTLERMTIDQATELLSLPRVVGTDPADGQGGHRRPAGTALRQQGQGGALARQRGAVARDRAGRGAGPAGPAEAVPRRGGAGPNRCGSWAPIPSASGRSSRRTVGSVSTSPTVRPTPHWAAVTGWRR